MRQIEFSVEGVVRGAELAVPPPGYGLVQRYEFPQGELLRSGDTLQVHLENGRIVGHSVVRAPSMPRGRRVGRVAALAHRVRC